MKKTVRKEISKDNYKFFIGRIEKIGNGQVGFIADTQKKAVELLGEKIPQNVLDAADNYKAFNIWLGSEVNPIIDSNGYKEEIIVIGDGYDFREVKEYSPSIEKIFATVTTEIKPHIKGKYFMQIDDSWYQQSVRKNFSTLEDAVKIARIMHSELRKVSRHIEATVEARTVDISKYYFRSDDWTKFFEIDNYGNEKVLRRETVDVIAKIDNRTVEEVRNDVGRCTDNYGIYKNSAAAVEKLIAEVDAVNAEIAAKLEAEEINAIDDYIVDVDAAAEVEEINAQAANEPKQFEVGKWYYDCSIFSSGYLAYKVIRRTKTMITLTDAFGEVVKRKPKMSFGIEEISFGGEVLSAKRFCTNLDEIQKAEEQLEYSIAQNTEDDAKYESQQARITAFYTGKNAVAAVGAEKNSLKDKIHMFAEVKSVLKQKLAEHGFEIEYNAEIEEFLKQAWTYPITNTLFIAPKFSYGTHELKDEKYVTLQIECTSEEDFQAKKLIEEVRMLNLKFNVAEANAEIKENSLKAKVAEILNRPRKSIIDWKDAIFQNVTLQEIFKAQKDFKKFLKLGQIDLAENVFAMLKTLCKNYRAVAA